MYLRRVAAVRERLSASAPRYRARGKRGTTGAAGVGRARTCFGCFGARRVDTRATVSIRRGGRQLDESWGAAPSAPLVPRSRPTPPPPKEHVLSWPGKGAARRRRRRDATEVCVGFVSPSGRLGRGVGELWRKAVVFRAPAQHLPWLESCLGGKQRERVLQRPRSLVFVTKIEVRQRPPEKVTSCRTAG